MCVLKNESGRVSVPGKTVRAGSVSLKTPGTHGAWPEVITPWSPVRRLV
jgi:hypothetical protein